MIIRKAEASDAAAILECLATAFEPYRATYTAGGFADTVLDARTIHERLRTMTLFVAERDGAVIGTIGCQALDGAEGHLRGMAVRPDEHGSGAARALLEAAEDELRARGCTRVTLDTTRPLQRATRFYEKNGYRATGRSGDFFGMPLFEYAKELS